METWSVDQVCHWLMQNNLGELVPKFQEEEVSGASLLALNDRMVQQLVRKIGHQAILVDLIEKCKQMGCDGQKLGGYIPEGMRPGPVQVLNFTGHNSLCKPTCTGAMEQAVTTSLTGSRETEMIDKRVLKQRKTLKHTIAKYKALEWAKSYVLPEFPYDIKCWLAEGKCPDHSMRIRVIEVLQADLTKYLKGSLYPSTQQYNDVVNALLKAYPSFDKDGNGFLVWKRALKDRFKYIRRSIHDDEQVIKQKSKFGHRRGQTRKVSTQEESDEVKDVKIKEELAELQDFYTSTALHVEWLRKEYMKTEWNWEEINNRMTKTFGARRRLINSGAPLKEVLEQFPFLKCPYQLFKEFHLLTHIDIYKKMAERLGHYSEKILSLCSLRGHPLLANLQESLQQCTEEDFVKLSRVASSLLTSAGENSLSTTEAPSYNMVQVPIPVIKVKNPFSIFTCEFTLYVKKEPFAQLDDCTMALAAFVSAFHVFRFQRPRRLQNTLAFIETIVLGMGRPESLSAKVTRKVLELQCQNS
nr:PREDICTED: sterile alpha motif domain-containing protein 3 [Latimeria chalumnae]|eukprot:XP_014352271.1 PREDICTED: sterile alpha motif domain-containing protein 3 [Latimeria chalumnae]